MIIRRKILATFVLVIPYWLASADAQQPNSLRPADRWDTRLMALAPNNPMAYFELAEEIADDARDQTERNVARHLFALAGTLDPNGLGRSASLALADMEDREYVKRRLLALASLLDVRGGVTSWAQPTPGARLNSSAAVALGEALSYYRRGRGPRALAKLDEPGATELLESVGQVLRGGAKRFIEDCKLYRGRRRPTVTEQDLHQMLQMEAAVLAGVGRAWSGELLLGRARPLVEVDPDNLQQTFGVDAALSYYRDGQWVAHGNSS